MNRLLEFTRSILLLLLLSALAFGLLRELAGTEGRNFEFVLALGIVGYVAWRLVSAARRLWPKRDRSRPTPPRLAIRTTWIGPRSENKKRRRL